MNSSDLNAALARPRRFLILMSLVVVGYYSLEVGVRPEAEYSGFGLRLGRPEYAIRGLWVIWGWALWRYGQKVYELLSAIWNDILDDVRAEDVRIAMTRCTREANRLARAEGFEKAPRLARVRGRVGVCGSRKATTSRTIILRARTQRISTAIGHSATVGESTHWKPPSIGRTAGAAA